MTKVALFLRITCTYLLVFKFHWVKPIVAWPRLHLFSKSARSIKHASFGLPISSSQSYDHLIRVPTRIAYTLRDTWLQKYTPLGLPILQIQSCNRLMRVLTYGAQELRLHACSFNLMSRVFLAIDEAVEVRNHFSFGIIGVRLILLINCNMCDAILLTHSFWPHTGLVSSLVKLKFKF